MNSGNSFASYGLSESILSPLNEPTKAEVKGLQICRRFLSREEAQALRKVFQVHLPSDWSPYE